MSGNEMEKLAKQAATVPDGHRVELEALFSRLGSEKRYHSGFLDGLALAVQFLARRIGPEAATAGREMVALAAEIVVRNQARLAESERWANTDEVRRELQRMQGRPEDEPIVAYDFGDALREIEEDMDHLRDKDKDRPESK